MYSKLGKYISFTIDQYVIKTRLTIHQFLTFHASKPSRRVVYIVSQNQYQIVKIIWIPIQIWYDYYTRGFRLFSWELISVAYLRVFFFRNRFLSNQVAGVGRAKRNVNKNMSRVAWIQLVGRKDPKVCNQWPPNHHNHQPLIYCINEERGRWWSWLSFNDIPFC